MGPESFASGKSVTPSFLHSMSIGKSPSITVQTARRRLPRVRFLGNVKDSMTGATEHRNRIFEITKCEEKKFVQGFYECGGAVERKSAGSRKKLKKEIIN